MSMIKSIELENFKCFPSIQVDCAPLTIITGINGMGKSSVIQSLLLLRQSFDERYLQNFDEVFLDGELVNLVSGHAMRFVEATTSKVAISIDFEEIIGCRWEIESGMSANLLQCTSSPIASVYKQSLFADSFCYLDAERIGPQVIYEKSINAKHKGRLGTKRGELVAGLLFSSIGRSVELPIPSLRHPEAESSYIHHNLSAWLSSIVFPGTQVKSSEKRGEKIELTYSNTRGRIAGIDLSPVNVAFGFSYILPIVLAVLTAEPGSLLIVENPEAHLHPAAQSKIGKLLALAAQNGVQVLIETHSDHLLNGVRVMVKESKLDTDKVIVHFLNADHDSTDAHRSRQTLKIRQNGKLDGWPAGFFDEWENNLRQLI